jgi:hypothetical protein
MNGYSPILMSIKLNILGAYPRRNLLILPKSC